MENNNNHKPVTLDDLAVITANGFSELGGRMEKLENTMTGLRSSVNNYLDLSDARYLELKHRDALIANWVKVVAEKAGVPVDLGQLDKVL